MIQSQIRPYLGPFRSQRHVIQQPSD